jgi:hypothetical protein
MQIVRMIAVAVLALVLLALGGNSYTAVSMVLDDGEDD